MKNHTHRFSFQGTMVAPVFIRRCCALILCCLLLASTEAAATAGGVRRGTASGDNTHECIVYIQAAMAKPGEDKIPHKLVCATNDGSHVAVTLLGDATKFFSGPVLSGVYRLTIPATLISFENTVNLDDPAAGAIKIETRPGGQSRATYTGTFTVLIVRLSTGAADHTYTGAQISTNNFDTTAGEISMKSIYKACSKDQLTFNPATGSSVTNGVIESTVFASSIDTGDKCISVAEGIATSGVSDGSINSHDFVMAVCPTSTDMGGAAGVANLNGFSSWYGDYYGSSPTVVVHEIGHNLNFDHSGKGTDAYGDQVDHMGGSDYDSGLNYGRQCFNGAKSYQTGWYPTTSVEPAVTAFNGDISDANSFSEGSISSQMVVVKLTGYGETPLYLMLHMVEGITDQYMSADDQTNRLNIVRQAEYDGGGYGQQSWTEGFLASGEIYSKANWAGTSNTLKVEVCSITTGSPDVAKVIVYLDGVTSASCSTTTAAPTTSPVASGTPAPTTSPVASGTSAPTTSPVASGTPAPTTSPVASGTPAPTTSPVASGTPAPTTSPVASGTPAPTTSPVASGTPAPTTSPVASGTPAPTTSPVASPSVTQAPVTKGPTVTGCSDSPLQFLMPSSGKRRSCKWVGKKPELVAKRCQRARIYKHCQETCNPTNCLCVDSEFQWVMKRNGKIKSCDWVGRKAEKLAKRCAINGVKRTCRKTCNVC